MNPTVTIVKGIAIILMVVGHSGCPDLLNRFIYSFHMPLFFFVSSYLFNNKHLENWQDFIKRKMVGLYIPFVKWSLLFLILHNVFAHYGIYEQQYPISECINRAIHYIGMMGSEQLLGGYWFLKELLLVSFICYGILYILRKVDKRISTFRIGIIALGLWFISFLIGSFEIDLPLISSRTFLACFVFFLDTYFEQVR